MKSKSKLILNILTIIGIVAVIFFIYFAVKERWFLDNEILLTKIKSFGLLAPLCFILIQMVQVVLPVIPGGASCLVGVMAFGAVGGFIYNYVGLVLGSICSFLLSRKFGMSIINILFKEPEKYKAVEGGESIEKLFERTGDFLRNVVEPQLEDGKNIVIIGHGAMNSGIICQVRGLSTEHFWDAGINQCELLQLK